MPTIDCIFSRLRPPNLNIIGFPSVNEIIVDSMPISHLPPSRIYGILLPSWSLTCFAVVGLMYPNGFALGAAKGKSRLFKRIDSKPVWSVTCLFIRKDFRRDGLSSALIKTACNNAFIQGAKTIEAYPIIPKKDKMPEVFAWVGFAKAYKNAGFKVVSQPSETRLIMRLTKDK